MQVHVAPKGNGSWYSDLFIVSHVGLGNLAKYFIMIIFSISANVSYYHDVIPV